MPNITRITRSWGQVSMDTGQELRGQGVMIASTQWSALSTQLPVSFHGDPKILGQSLHGDQPGAVRARHSDRICLMECPAYTVPSWSLWRPQDLVMGSPWRPAGSSLNRALGWSLWCLGSSVGSSSQKELILLPVLLGNKLQQPSCTSPAPCLVTCHGLGCPYAWAKQRDLP